MSGDPADMGVETHGLAGDFRVGVFGGFVLVGLCVQVLRRLETDFEN